MRCFFVARCRSIKATGDSRDAFSMETFSDFLTALMSGVARIGAWKAQCMYAFGRERIDRIASCERNDLQMRSRGRVQIEQAESFAFVSASGIFACGVDVAIEVEDRKTFWSIPASAKDFAVACVATIDPQRIAHAIIEPLSLNLNHAFAYAARRVT